MPRAAAAWQAVIRLDLRPAVSGRAAADPRAVLARLMGVSAALCWLALLPGWLPKSHPFIAVAAVLTTATTVGLTRVARLTDRATQVIVGCGPLLVAGLILVAGQGPASAAFACLALLVCAYAAMFFRGRSFRFHLVWCVTATGTALTAISPGDHESGYLVVVLAVTMSTTGMLLSRLVQDVWHVATHDPLTGLLNEHGLRADAAAESGALVVWDIDHFSRTNDALGREAGDELLRAFAQALTQQWPAARLARIAADTFAARLDHCATQPADDDALIHRVTARLAELRGPYPVSDLTLEIAVTAGVASADGSSVVMLLSRATTALAAARRGGREHAVWSADMDRTHRAELELHAQLRSGIDRGELRVYYQPQIAFPSRRITGVEALIRWQHPDRGLLGPGAFLAQAERTPLITNITHAVLADAAAQAARWVHAGTPVGLSVNLSARSLTDDYLSQHIAAHLDHSGLPPDLLTVEITETAIVAQPDQARRLLTAIRALGVRVSIDDFGTGHTSLALLADLPVDELKADRRFVAAATSDPAAAAIVATIADLAHRLGLHAVAEGVEDESTGVLLDALGYDTQQGFLYGRPEPAHVLDNAFRVPAANRSTSPVSAPSGHR